MLKIAQMSSYFLKKIPSVFAPVTPPPPPSLRERTTPSRTYPAFGAMRLSETYGFISVPTHHNSPSYASDLL